MIIELANKIRNGRDVGNEYVVTRRDETPSRSGIIARFETHEQAVTFIASFIASARIVALVETGATTVEAMRAVLGNDVTDQFISDLYTQLREKAGVR